MPANPILQIAPYLLAASQISRAVADIVEGLQLGKMTPEQVQARWQAAADAVLLADAQWSRADGSQADAAAGSG
ncbi:hypothetical protein [Rhodospirillaceae bacterium SYSU D60014]|uniref:hypothetical protein n=1 Tax=Virgifigura deserti TaxID=2268457 RepID=UPI000E66A060